LKVLFVLNHSKPSRKTFKIAEKGETLNELLNSEEIMGKSVCPPQRQKHQWDSFRKLMAGLSISSGLEHAGDRHFLLPRTSFSQSGSSKLSDNMPIRTESDMVIDDKLMKPPARSTSLSIRASLALIKITRTPPAQPKERERIEPSSSDSPTIVILPP
jgi:hypothetical protein